MPSPSEPSLIAISLRSLKPHPFPMAVFPRPQQAIIVGTSAQRDYVFRFETGPLNEEQTRRCRLLEHHGSTVVAFSDEEHWFYRDRKRWEESMIRKAMDKIGEIYDREEAIDVTTYDPELADAVLEAASKAFPRQLAMVDLKSELEPEPSDHALFTAIDALEADGLIEAKAMRSGLRNEIENVAFIRATLQGRRHLSSQSQLPSTGPGSVFHGDQIINYGPVGAIGRHAHGVVNVHDRWAGIEHEVDLQVLSSQLDDLRGECRKNAVSREDDKQVALLGAAAEAAEKGDGRGAASILSRAGKNVLKVARDIGNDVAAKIIAEMTKDLV
jgi:hypothetical protein